MWAENSPSLCCPQGQPQIAVEAQEGESALTLVVDSELFEAQRAPVEVHRTAEVGDVEPDVAGSELRG